ncbi:hypothetical protein JK636_18655 [Clostridium sp. YIM B02515]|uniref:Uncharacterized protein n=1 Tax=Clostridium rhizosphaerae TaxID=2803861 RepID=A0ABS1TEF8_9CLOT|nr:hypothetical protein [Clostridium rhizosphaerae]MBL4937730.1 hypothetical protein [Clostridium rhizosphaerae]
MRAAYKISKFIFKIKRLYGYGEDIPKTGLYQCKVCKEEQWLNRYGQFPLCNHKTNFQRYFKEFLHLRTWKFISENNNTKSDKEEELCAISLEEKGENSTLEYSR